MTQYGNSPLRLLHRHYSCLKVDLNMRNIQDLDHLDHKLHRATGQSDYTQIFGLFPLHPLVQCTLILLIQVSVFLGISHYLPVITFQ